MNNVSGRSTRYIIGVPPSKRGFTTLRENHVQRWLTSTRKTRTQGEPSFFCYFFAGSVFHTFSSPLSNFPSLSPSYVSYSTDLFFCHLCYQVLVVSSRQELLYNSVILENSRFIKIPQRIRFFSQILANSQDFTYRLK